MDLLTGWRWVYGAASGTGAQETRNSCWLLGLCVCAGERCLNDPSLRWPYASWLLSEPAYLTAVCHVHDIVSFSNIKVCGLLGTLTSLTADWHRILSSCPLLPIWWDNTQSFAQACPLSLHPDICDLMSFLAFHVCYG